MKNDFIKTPDLKMLEDARDKAVAAAQEVAADLFRKPLSGSPANAGASRFLPWLSKGTMKLGMQ